MKKLTVLIFALSISTLTGCATQNDAIFGFLERQNLAQWAKIEDMEREHERQERAIERTRTKAANLETESKRLRKVLCEKHPEDCPASVLDR